MKVNGSISRRISRLAVLFLGLVCSACVESVRAQPIYQVGQVVSNFTLMTRRPWTNDAGRAFMVGTPLRLSDFSDNVVLFEFFDAT